MRRREHEFGPQIVASQGSLTLLVIRYLGRRRRSRRVYILEFRSKLIKIVTKLMGFKFRHKREIESV